MEYSMLNMIISACIFITAYGFIIWDKFDRAVIALTGAIIMILFKIISQEEAFSEIDGNTIGLLIGMMMIVMIMKRTGIFEFLAIKTVKVAKGEPVYIIILLSITTGLLSGVLDNVTTVMLMLPVTITIAQNLGLNPIPFIISEVFASNVGGTATLVGDPPNIMIGSSVNLSFMDFVVNNLPIALPLLFITTYIFVLIYKNKLITTNEAKLKIISMNEYDYILDKKLLLKSIIILIITIVGFVFHGALHLESATVAMSGAVLLLLVSGIKPEVIMHEIEWKTIFFFIGLFVMVGGVKETGLIKIFAQGILDITNGDAVLTTMAILWIAAIGSALLDNIPFVATMIPMIKDMGIISGMDLTPVWWALSLGACLGGNGTIIGASANVVAIGIADESGHKITFYEYFKVAFPMMIFTVMVSMVYLYIRYFQ